MLLAALFIQGCAWVETVGERLGQTPETRLETLRAQHRYQDLLAEIDKQIARQVDTAEQDNASQQEAQRLAVLKQQAQQAAADYQVEKLGEINAQMARNQWSEAGVTMNFLLQNMPANDTLEQAESGLRYRRQEFIDRLQRQLAELEAAAMPQTLPLYEKLFNADNEDDNFLRQWQRAQNRRDSLLDALSAYADKAVASGDYASALKYLRLAQQVQLTEARDQRIRQLDEQISQQLAEANSPLADRRRQRIATYKSAVAERDWLAARVHLDQMLAETPNDAVLAELDGELDDMFANVISDAKARGEAYYSAGEIEQALVIWQQAQELAPADTQLSSNIERAQRILDKVKSLQQGQPEESAAGDQAATDQ